MTLSEVAKKLNLSEHTLKRSFNRTKVSLERRGIILIKIGRGENADYQLKIKEN